MKEKLKPCPFCGYRNSLFMGGKPNAATYGELPHITCLVCCVEGPVAESVDEAIALWNKRAEEKHG
jgi:Lar family restriction alleviation protein